MTGGQCKATVIVVALGMVLMGEQLGAALLLLGFEVGLAFGRGERR